MALKTCLILYLLLITLSPMVFAEIIVTPIIKDTYNLGDTISASAFVKQTDHLQGLLKLTISCNNYALAYSITPLFLEYGVERKIEAPLTLIGQMTGDCEIIANYDSIESSFTEEERSNKFTVTTGLDIEVVIEKSEFLPQEEIIIAGTVKRKSGEYVGNETIILNFQDKDYKTEIKDGRFIYKIEVSPSTKSGTQNLVFMVKDKNGNQGELSEKVTIIAIPSRLSFKLNKKSFNPLEVLEITPYVYDQSDIPIEEEVDLKITNPMGKTILDKKIPTNKPYSYAFDYQAPPGEYEFKISKEKLSKGGSVIVNEVEDLDVKLEGNIVYIKNIGNIEYKDSTTIVLESETKKYILNKKISLDPGETMEIDLSKEVKEDSYDITLPIVKIEEEQTTSETEPEIIKNVKIEDNRGIIKKTTQGLGDITGLVVAPEGKSSSKPTLAVVVVTVIVLAIIIYYRKGLKKKTKPEEETIALDIPEKEEDSEK